MLDDPLFGGYKNRPLSPWLGTSAGGKVYPFGIRPEDFDLTVIAHALSNICRYGGHTSKFWSVAAHSIEVAECVLFMTGDKRAALHGLMHDASETFLGDIPAPIKPMLLNFKKWELAAEQAVEERYGLSFEEYAIVDVVDKQQVPIEVFNFFPAGSYSWKRYDVSDECGFKTLNPLSPEMGKAMFIEAFISLNGGLV